MIKIQLQHDLLVVPESAESLSLMLSIVEKIRKLLVPSQCDSDSLIPHEFGICSHQEARKSMQDGNFT